MIKKNNNKVANTIKAFKKKQRSAERAAVKVAKVIVSDLLTFENK